MSVRDIASKGAASTMLPLARHRFTVDEYHRMAENGVLTEDDRVELIDGEIIDMAPIGIGHSGNVNRFLRVFSQTFGNRVTVSIQNPVRLGVHFEPEPDVAVLRFREDDYASAHPTPADAHLLIEVADSSLAYDRDVKGPMYARAGIPELWIVNLIESEMLIYREPSPEGYRSVRTARKGDVVKLLAFPDVEIAVSDVLL